MALLASALPAHAQAPTAPIIYNFDGPNPKIPFTPYSTPGGVTAAVKVIPENGAVTLRNLAGGSFGVNFGIAPIDVEKYPYITFDYQVDNQTKVDFFLRINGKYHGIGFTGPAQMRPGSVLLGKVPNVVADGQWHRAVLPVREWLHTLYPVSGGLTIDEFIAGNWNNEGYLMAGMGGNGPGAQWKIDNLALLAPGTQTVDVSQAGVGRYSLDGGKPGPSGKFEQLSEGMHSIVAYDKAGKEVATVPYLATAAPHTGTPQWQDNDLVWPVFVGSGLDTRNVVLKVDEKPYPIDSPFVRFDGAKSEIRLRAGDAGLSWPDKATVALSLDGLKDTLGRGPDHAVSTVALDYSKHDAPAPAPTLTFDGIQLPGTGTFETGTDEWTSMEIGQFPGAIVDRVARGGTDLSNQYCLRMTCPRTATPFAVKIRSTPFDAAKFPILRFDYKITDRLRLDFRFTWNGSAYSIRFADRDTPVPRIGTIDNVQADGNWHTAEVPLLQWMKATQPGATNFTISDFSAMDDAWMGNAKGVQWWVDNFQFVPQLDNNTLKAAAQINDVTGLKGISWQLNTDPATVPDETAEGRDRIQTTGEGRTFLHVRAQNGAGHWSPAVHLPVMFVAPVAPPPPPGP